MQSKRVLNEHEKRVVAFHEAGHALCGELLPSVDRVHRISIVPRGRSLGYTLNLPAEDRYLKTREELLDYMTVLLGGRVAEQIVFGAITTGASDDLKRVADIAHSMVHDFAMSTGGVGRSPDGDVRLSETTLRLRDEERQDLVEEARRAAQKMIAAHRRQLDAFAARAAREGGARPRRDRADHEGRAAPRAGAGNRAARRGRLRGRAARRRCRPRSGSRRPAGRVRARADRLRRMFSRIDHIGVAVEEIDPALELYSEDFELVLAHREVVAGAGRRGGRCSTSARTTSSCSRRSAPTRRSASSWPGRGPGLHHVAYQVDDIDAALTQLKEAGMQLIDQEPRIGIRGSRVAFLHPRATAGVLTEIVEPAEGGH